MKEQLLAYMANLLSEVKDPKTFFLRTLTMLVLICGYALVEHPEVFVSLAKDFSREAIVQTIEQERRSMLPSVSSERVGLIYGQVYADLVYVAIYNPKQQNDYLDILSRQGVAGTPSFDRGTRLVIHKSSKMYLTHLASRGHVMTTDSGGYGEVLYDSDKLQTLGINYLYSCPIYSLDNIYSGHIGIGYKVIPTKLPEGFLESICEPNARAIRRYL